MNFCRLSRKRRPRFLAADLLRRMGDAHQGMTARWNLERGGLGRGGEDDALRPIVSNFGLWVEMMELSVQSTREAAY